MSKNKFKLEDGAYRITESQKPALKKFLMDKMEKNPRTSKGNLSKAGINTKTIITDGKDGEYEAFFKGSGDKWKFNQKKTQTNSTNLRNENLKISSSHLSQAAKNAFKKLALRINKAGAQADHIWEAQETGPIIRQLNYELQTGKITRAEYVKRLNFLRKQGIGNDPKNLQKLSGKDNTLKANEVIKKNKALEKLEKQNLSDRYKINGTNGDNGGKVTFKDIFPKNGDTKTPSNGGSTRNNGKVKINGGIGPDFRYKNGSDYLKLLPSFQGGKKHRLPDGVTWITA
tara:strand:- start:48 stop:905 length:858 start_codon:yes stop_codon:yes gene_type:complete